MVAVGFCSAGISEFGVLEDMLGHEFRILMSSFMTGNIGIDGRFFLDCLSARYLFLFAFCSHFRFVI